MSSQTTTSWLAVGTLALCLCLQTSRASFLVHQLQPLQQPLIHQFSSFNQQDPQGRLLFRSAVQRVNTQNKKKALFVATPRRGDSPQSETTKKSVTKKSQHDDDETANEPLNNHDNRDETIEMEMDTDPPPRFEPPPPHDEDNFVGITVRGSKFRKLKDMMWIRETVEDLTAAEFACSVEAAYHDAAAPKKKRRRRAVDYDKLLAQLNKRLRDLGCLIEENNDTTNVKFELEPGIGRGTTVYDDEERQELFEKILHTRSQLINVIQGYKAALEKEEDSIDLPFKVNINLPSIQIQKEDDINANNTGPKLYVRDDGTVDWEGALQDRAALQKFGTAVWARINGREPSSAVSDNDNGDNGDDVTSNHHPKPQAVTAKIEDTPQIVEARKTLTALEVELRQFEKAHTKLLSSALSEGQAVANVNLASLEPALRSQIRESADLVDQKKQQVAYKTLIYELERIYTYLVGEVGNPANKGYVPLQDRLNVAEFGLLESQIDSFTREIQNGKSVDADVLVVVGDQVTDLKRRLGIDFYVTGVTFDAEAIKRVLGDLLIKTKNGLAFYGRGCQLFWNDLVFCGFLIGRAAQGYTLKPREVRNLRRTIKDFFTFIPFIIILLIPLSPIGHVLVFGAIQRFFPDFFPSCFTEQRQNLLQLYETAEYSEFKINETLDQKISRLGLAAVYFVVNISRTVVVALSQRVQATLDKGDDEVDIEDDVNDVSKPNGASSKKSDKK